MRVIYDKVLVAKLTNLVRKILLTEWDPIGIGHRKEVQDEYDSYIPRICLLLLDKESHERIVEYLRIAEDHIGIRRKTNIERIERVARILADIDIDNIK